MGLGIWIRHEYGHGLDLDEGWAGHGSGMSFRSGRVGVVLSCIACRPALRNIYHCAQLMSFI